MKKIFFPINDDEGMINFSEVSENRPIFAKKNNKLKGMIILIRGSGWILKIGGASGVNGFHVSAKACMKSCFQYGYEFYVEDF